MKGLFEFRQFAATSTNISKHDPNSILEQKWAEVAEPIAMNAAVLTGRGAHRKIVQTMIHGLNVAEGLAREGQGVSETLRNDYVSMSTTAFETVAAWLRYARVPSGSKRAAHKVRKSLYWYDLEWHSRDRAEAGIDLPTGVLRGAWRRLSRSLRRNSVKLTAPLRQFWQFLFRP